MVLPVEKKGGGGSPNPGRVPCVIHNFGFGGRGEGRGSRARRLKGTLGVRLVTEVSLNPLQRAGHRANKLPFTHGAGASPEHAQMIITSLGCGAGTRAPRLEGGTC